jgi:hypothetical protein
MIYTLFVFLNSLFIKAAYANTLQERFGGLTESTKSTGDSAMSDFVTGILQFAVPLGIFSAFVLLGYAAFVMVTSSGNPEKLNEAREIITNAIIGVIMIGIGVIVLQLISRTLGLDIN